VRNSLPVEGFRAENISGLKLSTEDRGSWDFLSRAVEERPHCVEVQAEAWVERWGVRMLAWVTARKVRTLPAESLRFPWQWQSAKG